MFIGQKAVWIDCGPSVYISHKPLAVLFTAKRVYHAVWQTRRLKVKLGREKFFAFLPLLLSLSDTARLNIAFSIYFSWRLARWQSGLEMKGSGSGLKGWWLRGSKYNKVSEGADGGIIIGVYLSSQGAKRDENLLKRPNGQTLADLFKEIYKKMVSNNLGWASSVFFLT